MFNYLITREQIQNGFVFYFTNPETNEWLANIRYSNGVLHPHLISIQSIMSNSHTTEFYDDEFNLRTIKAELNTYIGCYRCWQSQLDILAVYIARTIGIDC